MINGNIANQRFEAEQNIYRLVKIIKDTPSNKDTRRWREEPPPQILRKASGKAVIRNRLIEKVNGEICSRIYGIMNQERRGKTVEFLPGWRISMNGGGTVIDCYPSQKHDPEKFKAIHARKFDLKVAAKKQEAKNALLLTHIRNVKSDYGANDLEKGYQENRHK
jgi:hypothetical protein